MVSIGKTESAARQPETLVSRETAKSGDPGPQHFKKRRSWVNAGGMHGKLPITLNRVLGPVSPFPCVVRCVLSQRIDNASEVIDK